MATPLNLHPDYNRRKPEKRWAPRATAAFALIASGVLWFAILLVGGFFALVAFQ